MAHIAMQEPDEDRQVVTWLETGSPSAVALRVVARRVEPAPGPEHLDGG